MHEIMRELLERDSFVPFQIVMNSGDRIRIEYPGLAVLGDSLLTYCFPRANGLVYLRLNQIALLQIDDLRA